jgi:radical SAM superfamily enzyme YgiQ (UPF0313 family)
MPPLNLAYLVTYLKNKGIKVDIYDFNIIFYNAVKENDKDYWCMENQLEKQKEAYINKIIKNNQDIINKFISQIIKSKINIIGFSINQSNFLFSLKVAERIKKENNNIKIIFGGSAIFYKKFRDKTPSEVCDYFIIGEGERAIYNLVKSLKKKKEIENISEIGTNKKENKNNFVQNKSIMNINEIPYPTFEEFDLELYSEKQLPILISRGCIGKCSYCVDWIMSGVYRFKNAERVVEELKYLKQKYNIDRFQLNDLLCNGNLKQLEDICDLIIKNNLKIDLFGYATIRKDMSIDLLKKMKEAGFISVHYGFESGSDEVLKLMNKNYTSKDAEQLIKKTKEAGLEVAINIIVGFPGESEKNFKETLNFIKRNKEYIDYIANVSICFIMRGSMIYNHPERFNFKLTDNVENWYDKYNNKRIRIKKAERITKLINDLNIKLGIKNFYN